MGTGVDLHLDPPGEGDTLVATGTLIPAGIATEGVVTVAIGDLG